MQTNGDPKKKFRVALAQIDTVLGDKRHNLSYMESLCHRAAKENAKMIVFPESATSGYSPEALGTKLWELSDEAIGGETDLLFTRLANELNLVIISGFVERGERNGQVYNSAGVWVPGFKNCQHVHRKIHLYRNEKNWYDHGNELKVIETPLGRIGVIICFDTIFPETSRLLAMDNADIIVSIACWSPPFKHLWNTACVSRAQENGVYFIGVNRWGKEEDIELCGSSSLVNPLGEQIVRASDKGEDFVIGEIDLELGALVRIQIPHLKELKPHIYAKNYAKHIRD